MKDNCQMIEKFMKAVRKSLLRKKKTIDIKSLTFSDVEQQRRKAYKYEF